MSKTVLIGIKTKSERGTEKLSAEYKWLIKKAVEGGEKELKKLHRWTVSHMSNISFYTKSKEKIPMSNDEKWESIKDFVKSLKEAKE